MSRIARMLRPDKSTVYHVISRSALPGFPLSDADKDHLVFLLRKRGIKGQVLCDHPRRQQRRTHPHGIPQRPAGRPNSPASKTLGRQDRRQVR